MIKPQTAAAIFVAVVLLVVGAACGSDDAEPEAGSEPKIAGLTEIAPEGGVPATGKPTEEPGEVTSVPSSSGMMLPRPDSVEALVVQSRVIVLGTISSVLGEKMRVYGEDGSP